MRNHPPAVSPAAFLGAALLVATLPGIGAPAHACDGGPPRPTLQSASFTNNTGMPANDLHVNLDTQVRPDVPATATPTPSTVTPGPSNLSLDTVFGNPVPNGQTATLNYATLNPSSKVTGGTWTQDGNVIGSIPTEPLHLV